MILFQLYFQVSEENYREFEATYTQVFEPALRRQKGMQSVRFLRRYSAARIQEIEGLFTEYNYQVNFVFDSEENRRTWATSPDHDVAWPKISALATQAAWCGFDLVSDSA
jgi:hypothetical protein